MQYTSLKKVLRGLRGQFMSFCYNVTWAYMVESYSSDFVSVNRLTDLHLYSLVVKKLSCEL